MRSLLTIMPNEGGGCEQMQWFYDLDSEVLLVNLKESEFLKESESEHGDKTYLVRTDLAGQVKPQRSFNFSELKRLHSQRVDPFKTISFVKGCANVRNGHDGGVALQLDAPVGVG